jgi:hypothetical protein
VKEAFLRELAARRRQNRRWHLIGLGTRGDQQFGKPMEQRHANADLGDLCGRELRQDLRLHFGRRRPISVDKGIRKRNRCLMASRKLRIPILVSDLLDQVFGQTILLRDREANILSIATVRDASIAQPGDFLRWMINNAVTPHLAIQRIEHCSKVSRHCRGKSRTRSH